jgi:hypothetical protein
VPRRIHLSSKPLAFVINVRSFWWAFGYLKNARAMAIGHAVLLGQKLEKNDLEHELIHVWQYQRAPLLHPVLYCIELIRKGYKNNKYEIEAYRKAGNLYKGPLS